MYSKKLLLASIIILLIPGVQAIDLDITVLNYITLNPVENANVSIINITTIYDNGLSDSNGNLQLSTSTAGIQTLFTHRLGYNDRSESLSITTDASRIVYLTTNTAEGIIRLSANDLTGLGREREFCLYFTENNRLVNCYYINDTVQIIVNTNYTIRPKLTISDLISIDQAGIVSQLYSDKIGGIIIIILLIMVVSYALMHKK